MHSAAGPDHHDQLRSLRLPSGRPRGARLGVRVGGGIEVPGINRVRPPGVLTTSGPDISGSRPYDQRFLTSDGVRLTVPLLSRG